MQTSFDDAPAFPPEILCEIFSHCDPPTLAIISRVSLGCLVLSAEHLYEHVTLSTEQSLARLLRIPVSVSLLLCRLHFAQLTGHSCSCSQHPLTNPDFDPTDPSFKQTYPRGYTVPPQPTLTRISPYTSLSLIHSLTYTGIDPQVERPFAYLPTLRSPIPQLALPVLIVSLPPLDPAIERRRNHDHNITTFIGLFDPLMFVVSRRPSTPTTSSTSSDASSGLGASLLVSELPHNGPVRASDWCPGPWTRLSLVILASGIHLWGLGSLVPFPGPDGLTHPIQLIEDYRSIPYPAEWIENTWADTWEDISDYTAYSTHKSEPVVYCAWVDTDQTREEAKDWFMEEYGGLNEVREGRGGQEEEAYMKGIRIRVPTERVGRWMDELGRGETKGMDRDLLEELRRDLLM